MKAATAMQSKSVLPEGPTNRQIQNRFMTIWPELKSRIKRIARAVGGDYEENEAEIAAFCWANFQQAARSGRWLPASQLAWFSWARARTGRRMSTSTTDALDPQTHRLAGSES